MTVHKEHNFPPIQWELLRCILYKQCRNRKNNEKDWEVPPQWGTEAEASITCRKRHRCRVELLNISPKQEWERRRGRKSQGRRRRDDKRKPRSCLHTYYVQSSTSVHTRYWYLHTRSIFFFFLLYVHFFFVVPLLNSSQIIDEILHHIPRKDSLDSISRVRKPKPSIRIR